MYFPSPRIRRASAISLGMMVTRFAWIQHKLVSSKSPTRYASEASWRASKAPVWKRRLGQVSVAISRTRRWKGNFLMMRFVVFWNLRISRRAFVPGRYLFFFSSPSVARGFRGFLTAIFFLGAFPSLPTFAPKLLLAVCLVLAIPQQFLSKVYVIKAHTVNPRH